MKATDTKAVLLVGGLGTRLRTVVPSTPKPLAPVGDRPFLELLIRQLGSQGIRRLVMCTGYLADQIESEFGDGSDLGVAIEYSKEPQPLGTGGALKFAERFLQGVPDFLVMNGDSFLELDLHQLIAVFIEGTAAWRRWQSYPWRMPAATEPCTWTPATGHGVLEKTGSDSPGLINAGVYVFRPAILEYIPDGPVSLEKEVFPRLLDRGVYAAREQGVFIDIGTPADYAQSATTV